MYFQNCSTKPTYPKNWLNSTVLPTSWRVGVSRGTACHLTLCWESSVGERLRDVSPAVCLFFSPSSFFLAIYHRWRHDKRSRHATNFTRSQSIDSSFTVLRSRRAIVHRRLFLSSLLFLSFSLSPSQWIATGLCWTHTPTIGLSSLSGSRWLLVDTVDGCLTIPCVSVVE